MDASSFSQCRVALPAWRALRRLADTRSFFSDPWLLMLLFSFLLAVVGPASARVLLVPQEYPTITEGANAAVAGDTVLVSPGIYEYQPFNIKPGVSIIGAGRDSAWADIFYSNIVFSAGSEPARLEWFRISPGENGGGVWSSNPASEIRNNRFRLAWVSYAIVCDPCGLIEHNEIWGPSPWAIMVLRGLTQIQFNFAGWPVERAVVVADGPGSPAEVHIRNNTWWGTFLEFQGPETVIEIVNNIFDHGGIFPDPSLPCPPGTSIRYNDFVEGYVLSTGCTLGPGNMEFVDPMYCSAPGIEAYLHADSPLAHAGEGGTFIGAFPVGCGITSVSSEPSPPHDARLSVVPNPTRSGATFTFDGIESPALDIYDPNGRLIDRLRPTGQSATWLPGGDARPGVYFARLRGAGGTEVVKFLVVQ